MSISDKFSRFSASARWKADQQIKLLRIQNEIHVLENQIKSKKSKLAETALVIFSKDKLGELELIEICEQINNLLAETVEKNKMLEAIKMEKNPEFPTDLNSYSTISPGNFSGLVCPKCGKQLMRSHCPEHGEKGVPMEEKNVDSKSVALEPGSIPVLENDFR
jgi:hypothetical protein